jgi:hypothetical protein
VDGSDFLGSREAEHRGPGGEHALTKHNRRIAHINRQLATIERDIAVINEHCTASEDEFQEAVQRYKEECRRAFERAFGLAMASKQADAAVRKLV